MARRDVILLVALALLGVAASLLLRQARPIGRDVGDSAVAADILADRAAPQVAQGRADLIVVLFTDYQCPACRKSDRAMTRAIARDGNIRLVYRDWPIFGERSERLARIALAAHRQGIYPAVHHALMRAPGFDDAELRAIVERAGGDWGKVQSDLQREGPAIAAQLARNRHDAFALRLKGTPGYLIGPFLIEGALSEQEFLRAFAQARAAQ